MRVAFLALRVGGIVFAMETRPGLLPLAVVFTLTNLLEHAAMAVLAFRFLPGLRTAIPIACAYAGMNAVKFSGLNLVSAFAWASSIMLFVKGGSSTLGAFGLNNFYLHRPANSTKFRILPWDEDFTFQFTDTSALRRGNSALTQGASELESRRGCYTSSTARSPSAALVATHRSTIEPSRSR